MSDTPETDDIARGNHVVPTEWAKQLERERDEARRKLNNLDVTAIHSCHNECQRPICVLRRERDEARDELAEEMKFHHRTHSQLVNANCNVLDNQNDVMQLADRLTALELHSTSELARLEQERDDAREDADHWKIEYEIVVSRLCGVKHDRDNGVIFEHEIIPKLQRERDEALEEVNKLSGAYEDATNYYARIIELKEELDEAREVLKRIAHASMIARHKEEDYAEWEKAVESLQGICEEKNFINE